MSTVVIPATGSVTKASLQRIIRLIRIPIAAARYAGHGTLKNVRNKKEAERGSD